MSGVDRFRYVVGAVIVLAWVGSLIVDANVPDYEVPITVHGAMMLVAGYLFAPAIYSRRNGRRNGEGS